ncbi:BcsE family c-di-GMP-binding protein, partial [Pseudocitrobacter sp. 73]|uniref:BcsE family c-di-GMP-binding protein n=1 Tax=Pseudocitrobacter sp. 73 TaxID=2605731 RepID=UPI00125B50FD
MNPIFSIGIQSLWDEVSHMPTGGVWWINTDRHEDAVSLLNQTLSAQPKEARVAVVCMGSDPKKIIKLDEDCGPQKIDLFSMQENESSLYFMRRDLLRSLDPTNFLVVVLCSNNAWKNIPPEKFHDWLSKSNKWVKYHRCTLLILSPGNNSDAQTSRLLGKVRISR